MQRVRLKFVARFNYGDALPPDETNEGPFQVFGSNGPYSRFSRANTTAPVIVVGRKGSYGKVNWSSEPCFASDTTFYIDSTSTDSNLRWLYWTLQTLRLDEGSDEAAVPGLNRDDAYAKVLTLPEPIRQARIADHLDAETIRLDALVAKKILLLDLLAEKRRAVTARAVMRGVDAAAPMRNAGIEWLGDVPRHWAVERARWLFDERDERSETGEEELLSVSHITGVTARSEKDVTMFEAETTEGYKLCYAGDLVINTLWAWMGAMGVSSIDGIVSPAYNVYTPSSRLVPAYVDAIARIPVFAQEVTRYSKGVWSSRLRLYPEGFFQVHLPVPPEHEQHQIVAHIKAETAKIDELSAVTTRTIELLQERRAALITSVVTGETPVE